MIRRIQITNDLLDVIKSCPSGVIDDIYKIEYYIQGFDTVYEAEFTHEGDCLKVVLPSSELEKLESGILMRRAYYKVSDSSYPDGYYNLTFEDNMNVWLGSGESSGPDRQYVTEKELNDTLEDYVLKTEVPSLDGYATQSWVQSQGYVTAETLPEGIATQEWVTNQGYITSIPDTFATKTWVSEQGYLTEHQDLSSYALKSEIPSLDGYATESWISSQQFATQSWVTSQGYLTSTGLSGLATQSWVSSNFLSTNALNGYATQEWVTNQGYITSVPDTFATKNWVQSQNYLTEHQDLSSYALKSEIPSLDGYATQSWVTSQGYLTSHQDLTGYATEQWVNDQGYLTEHQSLDGYATQTWVSSQQFATQSWVSSNFLSTTALSGYATQSWATSQFLEESKIWTGSQSDWDALSSTQQALYTIALITE